MVVDQQYLYQPVAGHSSSRLYPSAHPPRNMTSRLIATALAAASLATAFPWVALQPGVDSSLLRAKPLEARQTTCPFNPVHPGAVPYNPAFPYNGTVLLVTPVMSSLN